jgi:hypothetical protein
LRFELQDADHVACADDVDILDDAGVQSLDRVDIGAEALGNVPQIVARGDAVVGCAAFVLALAVGVCAAGNVRCLVVVHHSHGSISFQISVCLFVIFLRAFVSLFVSPS